MQKNVETLDGWYCLHDIRLMNWGKWNSISKSEQQELIEEFKSLIDKWRLIEENHQGSHVCFNIIGNKGDIGIMVLRPTLKEIQQYEAEINHLRLSNFWNRYQSYLSIMEVGTYGGKPESKIAINRAKKHLYPILPKNKYICFYPMDKKRGESINWYTLDYKSRVALLKEHGNLGKKYAGKIQQMISGSIGLDDHEWAVTLFAENPLYFKKIIYDMRFLEASSVYSEFSYFIIGTPVLNPEMLFNI